MLVKECILIKPLTTEEFEKCNIHGIPMLPNFNIKNGFPWFIIKIEDKDKFSDFLEDIK